MLGSFILDAACLCHTGKLRKNNEDNVFFDGLCLDADNHGMEQPAVFRRALRKNECAAVFDGMGGENFGEIASFVAADRLRELMLNRRGHFFTERLIKELCLKLNRAVVSKARELCTARMGSTVVALFFSSRHAYICNLGDSRAYRLRHGKLLQLSVDHVGKYAFPPGSKAPLIQHLGIDPDEMRLEPHLIKSKLEKGDQLILCSDGLTDLVTDQEICEIMSRAGSAEDCVRSLVDTALGRGGKDNVTVIVCRIME